MDDRRKLANEMDELQQDMKELEVRYEQYFAGIEKREPYRERSEMARRLRRYTNRRIIQTDLKFRYQGLTSRFMTYCQYWDRILRLIDDGKYHRHTAKLSRPTVAETGPAAGGSKPNEVEKLHAKLSEARKACGLDGAAPSVGKVAAFLDAQREKIRSRYGDQPVEFSVEVSAGKPRIKVSLKK